MKTSYIIIGVIVIILIGGFFFLNSDNSDSKTEANPSNSETGENSEATKEKVDWRTVELTDVKTKEKFTISQFDKPVLLESFAVWCPTCTKQQQEVLELHEELDTFISISIDTDPNEDEQKVLDHINRNGFTWRYAIFPKEATESLIDDFGINVVNAPQAPMILICPDGTEKKLKNGVKSPSELKEEINSC